MTDWAKELTMDWGDEGLFPFIEDENANITGYGHQDKTEFASEINRYDAVCRGEAYSEMDHWTAGDIAHKWGVVSEDGERLLAVAPDTTDAIPLTTLWATR